MLEKIKKALRLSSDALNDHITDLVTSCKAEMLTAGICSEQLSHDASIEAITDPLLQRAAILYCKIDFSETDEEAQRYQKAYDKLLVSLALSGDYIAPEVEGE